MKNQWLTVDPYISENNGGSKFQQRMKQWLVGGFKHFCIFHFIYGMSSFPLTNSIIFQDGHIAPPTRYGIYMDLP
jgi:hypothetical protein